MEYIGPLLLQIILISLNAIFAAAEIAVVSTSTPKLEKMAEDKFSTTIRDISRPILSFPEEEPVGNIWEKFLEKKEHISVIIDEYGTFRGIVTLET